jgi:hypothetical protein
LIRTENGEPTHNTIIDEIVSATKQFSVFSEEQNIPIIVIDKITSEFILL